MAYTIRLELFGLDPVVNGQSVYIRFRGGFGNCQEVFHLQTIYTNTAFWTRDRLLWGQI